MATAEDKIIANRSKIAFANAMPYERVLDVVTLEIDDATASLTPIGTYDTSASISNPLGAVALPVTFVEWYYNGFYQEYFAEDDYRRILRQTPIGYGTAFQFTTTVSTSTIKVYSSHPTTYGNRFKIYVYLLEL